MKKLLIVFLFILFNIAVKAQDHVNHSSLNHVRIVIESALEGQAKLTDTVVTEGVLIFMIDTNGYVTSCKKKYPFTREAIVPFIPKINQLLAKYKFKVDPFVIRGIRYPSIAYLSIFVEPK